MIVLKRARPEHIAYVYEHLRPVDRTESALLHGRELTMDEMLLNAGRRTVILVALADGQPIALFGAGGYVLGYDGCVVWFLGTKAMARHGKDFLRLARRLLPFWIRRWGRLYNVVWAENETAVNTLRALGAHFVYDFVVDTGAAFRLFEFKHCHSEARSAEESIKNKAFYVHNNNV